MMDKNIKSFVLIGDTYMYGGIFYRAHGPSIAKCYRHVNSPIPNVDLETYQ